MLTINNLSYETVQMEYIRYEPKFPNFVEKFFGKKITDYTSHNEEVAIVPSVNIADENKAFEVSVACPDLIRKM